MSEWEIRRNKEGIMFEIPCTCYCFWIIGKCLSFIFAVVFKSIQRKKHQLKKEIELENVRRNLAMLSIDILSTKYYKGPTERESMRWVWNFIIQSFNQKLIMCLVPNYSFASPCVQTCLEPLSPVSPVQIRQTKIRLPNYLLYVHKIQSNKITNRNGNWDPFASIIIITPHFIDSLPPKHPIRAWIQSIHRSACIHLPANNNGMIVGQVEDSNQTINNIRESLPIQNFMHGKYEGIVWIISTVNLTVGLSNQLKKLNFNHKDLFNFAEYLFDAPHQAWRHPHKQNYMQSNVGSIFLIKSNI